jgi:hypothetical protein
MIEMSLPTLAFLSGALTFTMLSALLLYMMIGQVNRKLPNEEQIPYLFMYPGKVRRIKQEHRRFFPESRMNTLRVACNALAALLAAALAWRVGIFRFH